ncbi:MAG: hypothetical protein IIB39_03540 [Candidatus Marinimicrobia bacterium]|nr:hypothetical protein [Candidatus Neomarinimicrobiota bacterium]
MYKTIIKSAAKSIAVRQLSRYLISENREYDNPIDELNDAITSNGYIGQVWLKVKEHIKKISENAKTTGYEEGKQAGIEEYKIELVNEVHSFKKTVDSFSENIKQAFEDIEKSIVSLSVKIAEKILLKKISEDENFTLDMVNNSIRKAKNSLKVTVRVNPADYEFIFNLSDQPSVKNENVLFAPDENVEAGGCMIETDLGLIDAQVKTQLEVIEKDLIKEETDESVS